MESTTSVLIGEFLASLSSSGASTHTTRAYRADLLGWRTWANSELPDSKMTETAEAYVNAHRRVWAPKTLRRKISAIRSFGRFHGLDLLVGYRSPVPPRPQPHPLEGGIESVEKMIEQTECPFKRTLLAFCGLCGMRISEARSIRPVDVNLKNRTILVMGKGSKQRVIPISTRALRYVEGGIAAHVALGRPEDRPVYPWSDRAARGTVTALGRRADVQSIATGSVASHDLRATFATAGYEKTKDLRAVQELMGHANSATTEVYTGISMDAMRKAADL